MSVRIFTALAVAVTSVGGFTGCQTSPTQDGALIGGAIGAGTGAIVGHQSGKQGEGALIGAAAGALIGALAGDRVDDRRQRRQQQQQPVQQAQAAPAPAAQPTVLTAPAPQGRWETRTVTTQSGETYQERVWVPNS